jgi:hypothetical protein
VSEYELRPLENLYIARIMLYIKRGIEGEKREREMGYPVYEVKSARIPILLLSYVTRLINVKINSFVCTGVRQMS